MGKAIQTLRRAAALALIFGLSILVWGVLADLAIEFISMTLGELSEHAERLLLVLSTVIWLPLAIGTVWHVFHRRFVPSGIRFR